MNTQWNSVRANLVANFNFLLEFEDHYRKAGKDEMHFFDDALNDLDIVVENANCPEYIDNLAVKRWDVPLLSILSSFLDGFTGDAKAFYTCQDWPQVRFVIRLLRDSWKRHSEDTGP